jgi:hypothetical protein
MKARFAMRLLLSPALLVGVAFAALAQEPSERFFGFNCEVDLRVVGASSPSACNRIPGGCNQSFLTTDTEKNCTGSAPNPTIQMTCLHQLEGYTPGSTVNVSGFECQVWGGEGSACGGPGLLDVTTQSSMQISADGLVRLSCVRNRR